MTGTGRGDEYDARFARLRAQGAYLHGEADLVGSLLRDEGLDMEGVSILDAGCGTGRVAVELHRRGASVVGVEVDPEMLDVARPKDLGVRWVLADLSAAPAPGGPFDLALAAGNVLLFVALGSEAAVVQNLAAALRPGGLLVAGFQIGRQLPVARYDHLCSAAGLELSRRFATWEGGGFDEASSYAVSVHRRSA